MEEDPKFSKEFKRVLNNSDVKQAEKFTPEVLEVTYVNMEIALPRDGKGSEFYKVTKILRDENGIPIGRSHENPYWIK